jgi:FMN phosphatase YigB (HAD superfamily)
VTVKAVTFDAYGTLLCNEDLMLIPRRIVGDHGLTASVDAVLRAWVDHVSAWRFKLPAQFILISETARAYKPDPLISQRALEQLDFQPHKVLHVGDSELDDVSGARAAGLRVAWINPTNRPRRSVPAADFEIRDLTELPALL